MMCRILIVLSILTLLYNSSIGQTEKKVKKIQLKKANSLEFDSSLGKDAKRLIGDVVFEHDGVLMYCDSAYLYSNNNLEAFSNVRILQGDTLSLFSQHLLYDGNKRIAEVDEDVRLQDKEMTLTTDRVLFDIPKSTASYYNGGHIVSKENTLESEIGHYHSKSKQFTFKKNVVLNNPNYVMKSDTLRYNTANKIAFFEGPTDIKASNNFIYCENGWYDTYNNTSQFNRNAYLLTNGQKLKGDSIQYNRETGIGRAYNNIEIIDTSKGIIIKGNYAEHFELEDSSLVCGQTQLLKSFKNDTLYLHADTLSSVVVKDSIKSYKQLYAFHHVKFFKSDLQGKCDSLVYNYNDSMMYLYVEPVIWSDENQLTADEISIKTGNGQISKLYMQSNSFIISQEDTTAYNQIKGKKMVGYFNENSLAKIRVEGNGETIYYAKDDNEKIGVNKSVCSELYIHFKEQQVESISFITKPEATLYPLGELPESELSLNGFKWRNAERPQNRNEIFSWE